ncbi:hypothetical protein GCM10027161_67680 [Microbispora hainanensis]
MGQRLGAYVDGQRGGLLAHGVGGGHGLLDLLGGRHRVDADDPAVVRIGHGLLGVSRRGAPGEPEGAGFGSAAYVHVFTLCHLV